MITKSDIRTIVSSCLGTSLAAELTDDTELAIDSLTLMSLQHLLEQRHGVVIDPTAVDLARFTSVNGIHGYLVEHCPEHMAATA